MTLRMAKVVATLPTILSFLHAGKCSARPITPLKVTSESSISVCSLKANGYVGSFRTGSPCTGFIALFAPPLGYSGVRSTCKEWRERRRQRRRYSSSFECRRYGPLLPLETTVFYSFSYTFIFLRVNFV